MHPLLTPAADPVTADPRHDALRQEVDKLGSPTGTAVDWTAVARLGAELTRDVGKDLNVVAYTTLAGFKLRDVHGLLAGLGALGSLLRDPPTGLTPARPKSRGSALESLLARLLADLTSPTLPRDPALLRPLRPALADLAAVAREALGDHSPGFGAVLRNLDAILLDLPPAPESSSTAPNPAPSPAAPSPSSPHHPAPSPAATNQSSADNPTHSPAAPNPPPAATSTSPSLTDPISAAPAVASDAWRPALAPYLAPLASPGGVDPAALEAFDDARIELAKLNAVTHEPVDWARVEARSGALLRDHTRDLRVAAWFALASFHRAGLGGLAPGLHLVAAVLDETGDAVHPRRPKARRETADWFVKQIAAAISSVPPADLRPAALAALDAAHVHLAAALQARLDTDAPSLRPLRDALQRAAAALPPPPVPRDTRPDPSPSGPGSAPVTPSATTPDPPVPKDTPAPPDQPSAPTGSDGPVSTPPPTSASASTPPAAALGPLPTPPAALADLSRLGNFLDTTGESLLAAARAVRDAAPSDPRGFRLLRVGLWLGLEAPPRRPDGTTAVPGLDQRDRDALVELAVNARWPGLLARCENLLVRHRYALDLQRLAVAALAGLAADYAPAALAVRAELRGLLTRLPVLLELSDRDGQPFADPETRRWISDEVLPQPGAAAKADPDDPAFWTDLPARIAGPDRPAALADAQARIATCPSDQLRFTRRLALADACERAGAATLAAHLLTGLTAELERRELERWDPPLAARCLAAAARCHRHRGAESDAAAALARLARLDPAATL